MKMQVLFKEIVSEKWSNQPDDLRIGHSRNQFVPNLSL